MNIRYLTSDDCESAAKLSSLTWLYNLDTQEEIGKGTFPIEKTLGLFDESNNLAACLEEIPFKVNCRGCAMPFIGIGGVACMPECRRNGYVRKLMEYTIRSAYDDGYVFSGLNPFSIDFYRKFGYEPTVPVNFYEISLDILAGRKIVNPIRRLEEGEGISETAKIHNCFAEKYNMCAIRTEIQQAKKLKGDTYKEQITRFILGDGAYVAFQTDRDGKTLSVKDWAVTDYRYFADILAVLGLYFPMLEKAVIACPDDLPLELFAADGQKVKHTEHLHHSSRIINVKRALSSIKTGMQFTIKVSDNLISQNNGVFLVANGDAVPSLSEPDAECDIRCLAPLLLGTYDIRFAQASGNIKVYGNHEVLGNTFVKQPLLMSEGF